MQQFRVGSNIDLCTKVLIAELALMTCSMQIAPAKSYYFTATREAGLVQIANSLTEQCGHKTFQISGFWADYGLSGMYLMLPVKSRLR